MRSAKASGLVGLNFAVTMLRADGRDNSRHADGRHGPPYRLSGRTLGIDGVAIGSDFDGATIPDEIGDAAGFRSSLPLCRDGRLW